MRLRIEAHGEGAANAEASLREEVEGVNWRCGWMGRLDGGGKADGGRQSGQGVTWVSGGRGDA